MKPGALQRGMTLIELVVAIVVIAISVLSVLALLASQATHSADAMVTSQAIHIADAYLNEVVQKQFLPQANPGGRANFNDVDDYNGLSDTVTTDEFGTPVLGLDAFSVRITVTATTLGAVPNTDARRIDVTVQHTSGITVMTSGYRTRYP